MPLRWDKGLTGKEWDLMMTKRLAERYPDEYSGVTG